MTTTPLLTRSTPTAKPVRRHRLKLHCTRPALAL
jgi:hypothetical protein